MTRFFHDSKPSTSKFGIDAPRMRVDRITAVPRRGVAVASPLPLVVTFGAAGSSPATAPRFASIEAHLTCSGDLRP